MRIAILWLSWSVRCKTGVASGTAVNDWLPAAMFNPSADMPQASGLTFGPRTEVVPSRTYLQSEQSSAFSMRRTETWEQNYRDKWFCKGRTRKQRRTQWKRRSIWIERSKALKADAINKAIKLLKGQNYLFPAAMSNPSAGMRQASTEPEARPGISIMSCGAHCSCSAAKILHFAAAVLRS